MNITQEKAIIKESQKKIYWSPTYGEDYGEKSERRCNTCQHICVSVSDVFGNSESCELGNCVKHLFSDAPNCPQYLECRYSNLKPEAYHAIFPNKKLKTQ